MIKKVIALGYFDSVHTGHRELLSAARNFADENGSFLCVSTFDDGFFAALGKENEEVYLLHERKKILNALGVNDFLVLPVDSAFLSQTKENFCRFLLQNNPLAVFVGEDYRFGKNAEGDVSFLTEYMAKYGVPCFSERLRFFEDKKISTTDIKSLLKNGETEKANYLLGQPFFITGIVRSDRKLGHHIGYPTANIQPEMGKIRILPGVYATKTRIDGTIYNSVTNVGNHPTFGDDNENVETFLFHFSGDIYDKEIEVSFLKYIRPIVRFNSAEELKKQIEKDIEKAKEIQ